jgi:alpha-galactosidase
VRARRAGVERQSPYECFCAPAGGQQLLAGCALDHDHIELAPGCSWEAPPALLAYSNDGINGLRRQTRRYWMARKPAAGTSGCRPVHFNSWEAAYFDHDCSSTLRLLEAAAELGAERFVLDDGWMRGRTAAGVGLGDWTPCPTRYPDGLAPIATRAAELGLSFGLWVEPEMVTLDSALARAHPDWVVRANSEQTVTGRGQYLLDITLPAVRDNIHSQLVTLLKTAQPDYLKWDMNRDLADLGPRNATAFTQAWYEMLQRLRKAFPAVQIEACSAGGARADCGALAYTDRIWPSDSMDPMQRFRLFRAINPVLPMSWLGAHVGADPSATSGAALPLSTRCALALLGHMGMELNPSTLTGEERKLLQRWIALYKTERDWLANADIYYLDDPVPGTAVVMLYAADGGDREDKGDRRDNGEGDAEVDASAEIALLLVLQSAYPHSGQPPVCRLPRLQSGARYSLELLNPDDCNFAQQRPDWQRGGRHELSGATLRHSGLRLPFLRYGHCALLRLRKLISTPQS